jgi:hypothetical protein
MITTIRHGRTIEQAGTVRSPRWNDIANAIAEREHMT